MIPERDRWYTNINFAYMGKIFRLLGSFSAQEGKAWDNAVEYSNEAGQITASMGTWIALEQGWSPVMFSTNPSRIKHWVRGTEVEYSAGTIAIHALGISGLHGTADRLLRAQHTMDELWETYKVLRGMAAKEEERLRAEEKVREEEKMRRTPKEMNEQEVEDLIRRMRHDAAWPNEMPAVRKYLESAGCVLAGQSSVIWDAVHGAHAADPREIWRGPDIEIEFYLVPANPNFGRKHSYWKATRESTHPLWVKQDQSV